MKTNHNDLKVIPSETLPELVKIVPKGSVRLVFWGLRVYIVMMIGLVIVGFMRGIH